ncbi:hypothetical protein ABZ362_29000 [Streptomyces sp. NPDC005951]|uniref:hypothetical protein n=1 Tax=Streptomyces sp. NPDC005951 TaxID=3154573 RepID=UPI0033FBF8A3
MVQTTLRSVPVADLHERADARQEFVGRDCLVGCLRERCRVDQVVDADEHDDQADRLVAEDLRSEAASGRGTEGGLGTRPVVQYPVTGDAEVPYGGAAGDSKRR